jgi:hypothetical protein
LPQSDNRHAVVTLLTQGSCSRKFGYIAGAFTLLASLQEVNTSLRPVLLMSTGVRDSDALASHAKALGAEAALVANVNVPSDLAMSNDLINNGPTFSSSSSSSSSGAKGEGQGALLPVGRPYLSKPAAADGFGPLGSTEGNRWFGKFTPLVLWACSRLFDTVVFLDADHLVLRIIDHLVGRCSSKDGIGFHVLVVC